jgi:DNA-binding transcriptional regulator YiaG
MTIKQARKNAGITQKQMSELLNIPQRTIEDWERGVRTPPAYVEKLIIEELKRIKTNDEIK